MNENVPLKRKEVGALGEKMAVDFLKKHGYKIVQRNFRCREGEIDIIARQGDCLVFVEVRTRKSSGFGIPEESITPVKSKRLVDLANTYLQSCGSFPQSWRIDVIAVELKPDNKLSRLEHIENALS
jgi:putative endonuclease